MSEKDCPMHGNPGMSCSGANCTCAEDVGKAEAGVTVQLDLTQEQIKKLRESAKYYGDRTLDEFVTLLCVNRVTARGLVGN